MVVFWLNSTALCLDRFLPDGDAGLPNSLKKRKNTTKREKKIKASMSLISFYTFQYSSTNSLACSLLVPSTPS